MLRALIALGLIIDAVVHLRLASGYQLAQPQGIGQGNLFRLESAVALLSAAYVLLRGTRTSLLIAAGVGASAFIAVVLTRYVSVPALGPIPPMHEPVWFPQKTISAVAEALTAVLALVALRTHERRGASTASHQAQRTDRRRL
ncbi:hypothetical protein GCM10027596_41250 [Nocardioides korecus]